MTRVTNFGRKRTFLQAGFDEPAKEPAQAAATTPVAPTAVPVATSEPSTSATTQNDSGEPPAKKKRKRGPRKKSKAAAAAAESPEAGDGSTAPVEGESKSADAAPEAPSPPAEPMLEGWKMMKQKAFKPKKEFIRSSEERRKRRIEEKIAATTCFACREKGHAAKDCPKASSMVPLGEDLEGEVKKQKGKATPVVGICYRCGSTKHNLSKCRKPADPENPLPFASCFVCSGKGHLAGACPQNQTKGVYPNGGCCKICKDTSHLAKDCTMRRTDGSAKVAVGTGRDVGADEDDFMALTRKTKQVEREEIAEERFKKLLDAAEHAPVRPGMARPANPLTPKAKKVVVF